MSKMNVTTTTKTTVETVIVLAGKELVEALKDTIESSGHSIVDIERVYISIPGGGDYSNMNLDIDSSCPLVIVLKKEKTDNERS